MDKQTRIFEMAKELAKREGNTMPFSYMSSQKQRAFLDLATERLHQQDAFEEAKRDSDRKEDIVAKAMKALPPRAIVGMSELGYLADVTLGCQDIPLLLFKNIFTVDVLLAFYFGEVPVPQAITILHTYVSNMREKTDMIKAIRNPKKKE